MGQTLSEQKRLVDLGSQSNLYDDDIDIRKQIKDSLIESQQQQPTIDTFATPMNMNLLALATTLLREASIGSASCPHDNNQEETENASKPYKPVQLILIEHADSVSIDDNNDNNVDDDKQEEKQSVEALDVSQYAVQYEHVHTSIVEFMNTIAPPLPSKVKSDNTNDNNSDNNNVEAESKQEQDPYCGQVLRDLFSQMDITKEDCKLWGGACSSFDSAKSNLGYVVDYVEKGSSYSKPSDEAKLKLRCIIKLISESSNPADYKNICLLLASHGNVCNVMKEVAISNAYGMMTNNLQSYIESQSLQQQVLKVLRDLRVLLIEKMFHDFGFGNNTHVIAGFQNTMAKDVGVSVIKDPDISYPSSSKHRNWKENLGQRFLCEQYTRERIVEWVYKQLNEKKISYQKIVALVEQHCPVNTPTTDWLQRVIDIDTGTIQENWMCWVLEKIGVLMIKDEDWKPLEKTWKD